MKKKKKRKSARKGQRKLIVDDEKRSSGKAVNGKSSDSNRFSSAANLNEKDSNRLPAPDCDNTGLYQDIFIKM